MIMELGEFGFELGCYMLATQTLKIMSEQPVYKEDMDTFASFYCPTIGIYNDDINAFKSMVRYGLEIISASQMTLMTMVPDVQTIRFGLANIGIEIGSVSFSGKIFYWKFSENKLKVYQRKPIFWDKYEQLFKVKKEGI